MVGVGTMGSQALWRLAARGAQVVGYEQFAPGHDRSAAGGDTRIFRSAHFEDTRYVPLLKHADRLWDQLQQESGRELRRLTGCLVMGEEGHVQMRTLLQSLGDHSLDHELLDAAALKARFPAFQIYDGDVAVLDKHAGFIRPEISVSSAASHAERLGAELRSHTRVRALLPRRDGVDVVTDDGTERFDDAVVTVGPWVNDLLPQFAAQVTIRRLINAWFVPTQASIMPLGSPAFIRTSPTHFYGVPSPDGSFVKVGLSVNLHRTVDDPNRLDREVGLDELAIFRQLIDRYAPGIGTDPVRLSVYMEGYTASSRPLVGFSPDSQHLVILAGFSGHGFKLSPAIGDIAADLVLNGETSLPIEFLRVPSTRGIEDGATSHA